MLKYRKDRRRHLPILFVLIGMFLFINLFSATEYSLLSVVVQLKMEFGYPAQTRVVLPPVGEIRAHTHWFPVRLSLELKSVDLSLLRNIVFSTPQTAELLFERTALNLRRALILFSLKLALLASSGAIVFLLILGIKEVRSLAFGGLTGLLVVLLIISTLYVSYDLKAFEHLEYEGMIEAAPWALNLAWEALGQVEELGERVQALAGNLYSVLQQLENLGPISLVQAEVVALHVSDIHNNPIAYDFAKQVIESFPVDFVLDTGDLTDWGTALEAEVIRRIEQLNIPYIFVSGNHDSPEVIRRLESTANASVIYGEGQSFFGLWIAGSGDLVATSYLPEPASLAELNAQTEQINTTWAEREDRPDIFMVHNHRVAEALKPDLFPVVVYGHSHLWGMKQVDGTVYLNAGTTGAAGLRGFQSKDPMPYSLSLLYFSPDENGQLVLKAVDGVHVTGLGLSFSLQRTFIDYGSIPVMIKNEL